MLDKELFRKGKDDEEAQEFHAATTEQEAIEELADILELVPQAQTTLRGLKLHLEALSQDYPENIKVTL